MQVMCIVHNGPQQMCNSIDGLCVFFLSMAGDSIHCAHEKPLKIYFYSVVSNTIRFDISN